MGNFAENLNTLAAIGTLAGQIFLLGVFFLWLAARFKKNSQSGDWDRAVLKKIGSHGLIFGFIVALTAVAASLLYSDVIGYEPCKLCWLQRIFLYPQVIILGLALWQKTKDAATYCLTLSSLGAVVAGYHFYGQSINPNVLSACDAAGGASCAVRFFVEFGYITIPMMSLTAFLLIIVFMLLAKAAGKV
ncbi:MAG: disulfide bond formation protein B [Candidatus Taylorbacteria bacterium]|nr:disulfide bond formation protein B [Candidatus Taylorbacteria bacterium]